MSRRTPTFDCFIGNVPKDATEKDVGKAFSKFGEIAGIFVKGSDQPSGNRIGFVRYHCEPDADRASSEVNGTELEGFPNHKLSVRRADPNKKRQASGRPGPPTPNKIEGEQKFVRFTGPDIVPAEDRSGTAMSMHNTSGGSNANFQHHNASSSVSFQDVKGEKEMVMVTFVESPITMWIQTVNEENTEKLFNVTEQLSAMCPTSKVVATPEFNKLYAAKFSEDGMWYRCVLRQNFGTDRMKVQYIDYGNTEEVGSDTLVEIGPALTNIKPLASKLVLHNTIARDLSDQKGIQFLRGHVEGKMAQVVKTRALSDGSGHYAFVFIEQVNIGDLVVTEGYAKTRPTMVKGPLSSGSGEMPSLSKGASLGRQIMAAGDTGKIQTPMQSMNKGPQKESPQNPEHQQALQNELTKKNRELAKLRNEKDVVTMELQNMRGKQANLKEENTTLSNRLLQSTLTFKVQTVIKLANTVRTLRTQFPSGKQSCLEDCMMLARSSEKVQNSSVTSLQSVVSAHATYQAAQKEISTCKDSKELNELVAARDGARSELHHKLQYCIDELNKMPLDERSAAVKLAEKQLLSMYSGFTAFVIHSCPQLDDLFPAFREWKGRKDAEFTDVRKVTDQAQVALSCALARLQQLFTLDTDSTKYEEHVDMDKLLQSYTTALQHEVTVTDLEHSRDASLVATVVAAVRKDLQMEVATLDNFTQLMSQFRKIKQDIEPWLSEKPSLTDIQESRKCLRGLKSKLRHKLADKQDLEESEGSGEELGTVKSEVEEIKQELHQALMTSDQLMGELAGLADEHFPELIIQHPDLGIDVQLSYNGVVKTGREIEHYTLSPGFRTGFYRSTFAGEPVIIQEFNIGDSDHRSREDFMKDIIAYNGAAPETSLMPIEAVFFSKNERQAYLQTKYLETETLESLVRKSPLSEKAVQTLVINITRGLACLHASGFTHGDVTPQNVLVQENGSGVLVLPDFSKSQVERARKRYTTDSGLVFQLPELIMNPTTDSITSFADVYNIGLLILWLHHPDTPIYCKPDGIPDITCVSLQPEVCTVLENVLLGLPELRVSAEKLLSSYYLSVPKPEPPAPPPTTVTESPVYTDESSASDQKEEIGSKQLSESECSNEGQSAGIDTSPPDSVGDASVDIRSQFEDLRNSPVTVPSEDQNSISLPHFDQGSETVQSAEQVSETACSTDNVNEVEPPSGQTIDNQDSVSVSEQTNITVTSSDLINDAVLSCDQITDSANCSEAAETNVEIVNAETEDALELVTGSNEQAAVGPSTEV